MPASTNSLSPLWENRSTVIEDITPPLPSEVHHLVTWKSGQHFFDFFAIIVEKSEQFKKPVSSGLFIYVLSVIS